MGARQSIAGRQAAESIDTAVVHGEDGIDGQIVDIDSELRVVAPDGPREVVRELIALFGALDIGIGLTSGVGVARNVDSRSRASGVFRVVEIGKAAARV